MTKNQGGAAPGSKISGDCVLRAAGEQVHCGLGDELVILGMKTGVYYGLNPIGTRVWQLVQDPIRFSELIRTLSEEYDVEEEQCESEVAEFLARLLTEELILAEPWGGTDSASSEGLSSNDKRGEQNRW